jgi:hypothetical protein
MADKKVDSYQDAIDDMLEKLDNANSNSSGQEAPWSYNFEFEDAIRELSEERKMDKDANSRV